MHLWFEVRIFVAHDSYSFVTLSNSVAKCSAEAIKERRGMSPRVGVACSLFVNSSFFVLPVMITYFSSDSPTRGTVVVRRKLFRFKCSSNT